MVETIFPDKDIFMIMISQVFIEEMSIKKIIFSLLLFIYVSPYLFILCHLLFLLINKVDSHPIRQFLSRLLITWSLWVLRCLSNSIRMTIEIILHKMSLLYLKMQSLSDINGTVYLIRLFHMKMLLKLLPKN